MLRNKPRLPYCGLTVVMSNPSRHDTMRLLSSNGGELFNNHCLMPEFNQNQCDIRVMEDSTPWIDGTKCVLLLGEAAMHKYAPVTRDNTLNEMRGSPLMIGEMPAVASFFPQDAADIKNYESEHNQESKEFTGDGEGQSSEEDEGDVKRFSNTKRSNYAFWLRADTNRAKQILSGRIPQRQEPQYRIYPSSDEVISVLSKEKDGVMDFDIETDYEEQNLLCFAFSFDGKTIYSVPVLNHNYQWAYSNLHFILRALAVAFRDNTVCAHYGHAFDFPVMARKYRIPVYKCWDTLMAMHRCFPDIEKSLGHCMSYWLWEMFHKDSDSQAYFTQEHMMTKLRYCAKDVFGMGGVRRAIMAYSKTIPGLEASIQCAMDSIVPYVTTSLMGIPYDENKRQSKVKENDRLMNQYLRIINLLIGEQGMADIRKCVKKASFAFPSSNKQCVEYFHNILGYSVVMRGKPDQHGTRNPSLAKKAMLKLRLKENNPVIDFCNIYRYTKLETTTPLGFLPWKDDQNRIVKPPL